MLRRGLLVKFDERRAMKGRSWDDRSLSRQLEVALTRPAFVTHSQQEGVVVRVGIGLDVVEIVEGLHRHGPANRHRIAGEAEQEAVAVAEVPAGEDVREGLDMELVVAGDRLALVIESHAAVGVQLDQTDENRCRFSRAILVGRTWRRHGFLVRQS